MKTLLILVVGLLVSTTCSAAEVQLHLKRDPRPWDGYPQSIGQPVASWDGAALHVRYVANENSTSVVSEREPMVLVAAATLVLCYNSEPVTFPIGQPIPAWTGPVLLEFVVTNVPQRDYVITVAGDCLRSAAV